MCCGLKEKQESANMIYMSKFSDFADDQRRRIMVVINSFKKILDCELRRIPIKQKPERKYTLTIS